MDARRTECLALACKVAERFSLIPVVEAVALGGSQSTGSMDRHSDIDLYIYARQPIPLSSRESIVGGLGAERADLDLRFWDLGDEWVDADTGIEVDVIHWDQAWIEGQIDRVLVSHLASVGYTTCFVHTVRNSKALFDRRGWFAQLQAKCSPPYPKELRRAIIAKNHPILRNVIPSYYGQIEKAIIRDDLVSVNHRVAALLASYFDVLFTLNYTTNPGEKKVLRHVLNNGLRAPANLQKRVEEVLQATSGEADGLLGKLDVLLDGLDELLVEEGIVPSKTMSLDE